MLEQIQVPLNHMDDDAAALWDARETEFNRADSASRFPAAPMPESGGPLVDARRSDIRVARQAGL